MRSFELVADRFVRRAGVWIDLATAEAVRLDLSDLPAAAGAAPWLERSTALWNARHPHLVPLIDYGCVGAALVFEAWRVPATARPWGRRDALTSRAIGSAARWLHRQGLTAGRLAWRRVIEIDGRPMLVADGGTGWPLDVCGRASQGADAARHATLEAERATIARWLRHGRREGPDANDCGHRRTFPPALESIGARRAPQVVSRLIEVLESGRRGEPRRVHLHGRPGPGIVAAVDFIAREARVRGFVPVATACLSPPAGDGVALDYEDLVHLTANRHVLLIHRHSGASVPRFDPAVRLVLDLGLASSRPHLILIVNTADPAADGELRLTAPRGLCECVSSGWMPGCTDPANGPTAQPATGDLAKASESHPAYRVPGPPGQAASSGTIVEIDAGAPRGDRHGFLDDGCSTAGHVRARNRCAEGLRLARQGRHAAGVRLLRDAAGALARRGDDGWAGRATLDLGRVLHWRGRTAEAARAFEQARVFFDRCGWSTASIRATVYLGLVWTDNGRLSEAEAALRAAAIAAAEGGSADVREFARLGLARCLIWQRRWEEARAVLAERGHAESVERAVPNGAGPSPMVTLAGGWGREQGGTCREAPAGWRWDEDVDAAVMAACLESRISVGRGDLSAAGMCAARAGARARQRAEARDLAAARTAAARVHAEIADVDGLRHHVREGVRASASAHTPLEALRLRLLLVDGLRRAGCSQEADRLADRLRRVRSDSVPVLLRRRIDAVARGQLSMDIEPWRAAGPPPNGRTPDAASVPAERSKDGGGQTLAAADLIDLLGICHEAADEAATLERIAGHVRQRWRASSVAFFGVEASELVPLSGSGCRPFPIETALRARDACLPISPTDPADPPEAAVPVRYGGATIGALACRWPVDTPPCPDRRNAVLMAAATLAAPAVRAMLDRRACPQAVLSAEPDLMGTGDLMSRLRTAVGRAAATPFPVLIEGESGSGKELVARAIHRLSPRRDRKYRTLNCAALTDELLEAELFGHARGAFTGAIGERAGLFEDADGGTLVLDEVGELSPRAQAKLLRALQEGEVRRVGENVTRSVDVRIVAAANRPLQDEVSAGRFRRDLFYRLAVIRVAVPPLRDRVDDIPVLANHFWAQAVSRTGSRATLAPATLAALARHDWPGNVRELQNVMTALAVSAPRRGNVGPESLPAAITATGDAACPTTLGEARRAFETRYVRAVLSKAGGHRGRAARDLGLSRQGFAKLLARLNVDAADP